MKTRTRNRGNSKIASSNQSVESQPGEFRIVRLRECPMEGALMDTPEALAAFWNEHVIKSPQFDPERECVAVFAFNAARRIMGFQIVTQGTIDSCVLFAREVFRYAILQNAVSVVVAHNHPSGFPAPSAADISVTNKIASTAEFLNIRFDDHVIIGKVSPECPRGFASMRELGHLYELSARNPAAPEGRAHFELESVMQRTLGLLELLDSHIGIQYMDMEDDPNRVAMHCGIMSFIGDAQKQLRECFKAVYAEWRTVTHPEPAPAP